LSIKYNIKLKKFLLGISPFVWYYVNNDLVEGDSALCQSEETLLTKMHCHPQWGHYLFCYTVHTIKKEKKECK